MLFVRLGGFEGVGVFVWVFLMLFVRLGGFEEFGIFVWVLFGRVGILNMFFGQSI